MRHTIFHKKKLLRNLPPTITTKSFFIYGVLVSDIDLKYKYSTKLLHKSSTIIIYFCFKIKCNNLEKLISITQLILTHSSNIITNRLHSITHSHPISMTCLFSTQACTYQDQHHKLIYLNFNVKFYINDKSLNLSFD